LALCRSLLSLLEALVKIGKEGLDFHSLIKSLEEVAHTQQSGLIPKQVRTTHVQNTEIYTQGS
jgi:hypothetical protein